MESKSPDDSIWGRADISRLSRYAPWRQRSPSPKALDLVLKMRGEATRDASGKVTEINMLGRRLPIHKITAGHVSAYLYVLPLSCRCYC